MICQILCKILCKVVRIKKLKQFLIFKKSVPVWEQISHSKKSIRIMIKINARLHRKSLKEYLC